MIEPLVDRSDFRKRVREAWAENSLYWLSEPLRHVVDVGDYIIERILALTGSSDECRLIDMGCGDCWILERLIQSGTAIRYNGFDSNPEFVVAAQRRYRPYELVEFEAIDVENEDPGREGRADLVVNSFNFFELADLEAAMRNVSRWLKPGGKLLMSTIDPTYLVLAVSKDWKTLHDNLRQLVEYPGVKFAFQKIDLGNGLSEVLEYPSVLHSREDFLVAANQAGLKFYDYKEHLFTHRAIPKIYYHMEFIK